MHRCALILSMLLITSAHLWAEADTPTDYAVAAHWVCLPGRADACAAAVTTTVVTGDREMSQHGYPVATDEPVDCFYVYPTVSHQSRGNADLTLDPEIQSVATEQFARFGAQCRTYAPLYRQTTVAAMTGEAKDANPELAYRDVVSAWHYYLAHYNQGRGVALIGHSQGATLLARLIAEQVDGRKDQARLLSAILTGTRIRLPAGRDVGGTFVHIPVCRTDRQRQCVIEYSSYLAVDPPGPDAIFGAVTEPGFVNACVNPSELLERKTLDTELPTRGEVAHALGTTFVENPGAYSASCMTSGNRTYLSIAINPDAPNAARLERSLAALSKRRAGWGLHGFDINLALGDLVELVGREGQAYQAQ